MFEQTKKQIARDCQAGVYPGYVTTFLNADSYETLVGGDATLTPKVAMTANHYFDLASLTKVIGTTSVVLRLIEQGKLALDDKIVAYLPEYGDPDVTIRHVITHTSGIQTWIKDRDQLTKEQLIAAYLKQRSSPTRDLNLQYTDTGFILLGLVLEKLTGESLATLFKQEVFDPLGMTEIRFGPLDPMQDLVVGTQDMITQGQIHDPKARILQQAGHAGLFATNQALILFVQEFLTTTPRVFQRATLDGLLQDHTNRQLGRSIGWDLKQSNTRQLLFHTGYTGTFLLIDRLKQRGWIFLTNRVHPHDDRVGYLKKRDALIQTYLSEVQKEDHK